MLTAQFPFLLEIGIFVETPLVSHVRAYPNGHVIPNSYVGDDRLFMPDCWRRGGPTSARSMHTTMPWTTVIPFLNPHLPQHGLWLRIW